MSGKKMTIATFEVGGQVMLHHISMKEQSRPIELAQMKAYGKSCTKYICHYTVKPVIVIPPRENNGTV